MKSKEEAEAFHTALASLYTVLQILRSVHRSELVAIFVHGFTAAHGNAVLLCSRKESSEQACNCTFLHLVKSLKMCYTD